MSAGYRNEIDAALAQVEALRQENSQLKNALAAEQATLAAQRQQQQAQLQAAWSGNRPPPTRTNPAVFVLVAVLLVFFLGGIASFLMTRPAAPMPVGFRGMGPASPGQAPRTVGSNHFASRLPAAWVVAPSSVAS